MVRSVSIKGGNPRVKIPVVQSQSDMVFSVEVGITNAYSEVLAPAQGLENFNVRVDINHSALASPASIIILNSRHIRLLRATPIEAGGTLVFTILGKLHHDFGWKGLIDWYKGDCIRSDYAILSKLKYLN